MADYTIPQFRWPVEFTSSNNTLEIDEVAGAVTVTIPVGVYWWRGDGSAADLATVLELALETTGAHSYTVDFLGDGILRIEDDTGTVDIDWSAGTIDAAIFGFTAAATGSASGHTSDFQIGRAWFPQQVFISDSRSRPVYGGSQQRMADGSIDTQRWSEYWAQDIVIDMLPARKVWQAEEVREQEAWQAGSTGSPRPSEFVADGLRFEFCPDFATEAGVLTNPGTYTTMIAVGAVGRRSVVTPTPDTIQRWDLEIHMQTYVS